MPNGWWLLPSVVCGSAMWLWGGWTVYQAVQGTSGDVAERPGLEAMAPPSGPAQLLVAEGN